MFLIEYKKKYIDPYWSEEALKNNYPKIMKKETNGKPVTRQ